MKAQPEQASKNFQTEERGDWRWFSSAEAPRRDLAFNPVTSGLSRE